MMTIVRIQLHHAKHKLNAMRILKFFLTISCFWFIPFQLPAQDYWAGFSEVQYDGKNFYAVANQLYQVVKLDKSGEVLATFGKRGRGPREFMGDKLELLLVDSLLYILDDRAMHITTLDKKKFKSIDRKTIEKPSSELILYRENLYGYVTDFEESNPFKTGKQVNAFREINKLKDPKKTPEPVSPTIKKCPYCLSDIPLEATRCPHCTSNLKESTS
jgi:hypothetical protein